MRGDLIARLKRLHKGAGPTIHTTAEIPARYCFLCGKPAVAGTGVARPLWWCLGHLHLGLDASATDLKILERDLNGDVDLSQKEV